MAQRLELQAILVEFVDTPEQVYFQPPTNLQMKYPCIVYKRDRVDTTFADDIPYTRKTRYQVTIIDRNPDSPIPDKVGALPTSSFDRQYVKDGLNHDVYNLFF